MLCLLTLLPCKCRCRVQVEKLVLNARQLMHDRKKLGASDASEAKRIDGLIKSKRNSARASLNQMYIWQVLGTNTTPASVAYDAATVEGMFAEGARMP